VAHSGATSLNGKGQDLNSTLQATATLTHNLAGQDQRIVRLAQGLHDLAVALNSTDRNLGATIDSFSTASGMLADERDRLRSFLAGMASIIRKSGALITAYQETLPGTAANLSDIVMTLKAGSDSLTQIIKMLSRFADVVVKGWDRKNHVAVIRIVLNATVRAWLQPLFDAMGWGRVPCVTGDPAQANCPPAKGTP
jgi:ABC-type transporter Mla subunit MlaD